MLQSGQGMGRAGVMSEAGVGWNGGLFNVPGLQRNGDRKGRIEVANR